MTAEARARVERLLAAARRLQDPGDPLGREARRVLPGSTGLAPENVELALAESLETAPAPGEIDALLESAAPAPRAHVLLSANVFVAAHRALAVALAAAPDVTVRPSRREPETAALLHRAAPGLFRLSPRLDPVSGDSVWLYGSDATIERVRSVLPAGVTCHAHGSGMGVIVADAGAVHVDVFAAALARDLALFDQRGCTSPRIALVTGTESATVELARAVASALADIAVRVPRGRMAQEELAAAARYREVARFGGEVFPAGPGYVGVDVKGTAVVVPPVGRNLHVLRAADLERVLAPLAPQVTVAAISGRALEGRVRKALPRARHVAVGSMQRLPLDGPVDRRGAGDAERSQLD